MQVLKDVLFLKNACFMHVNERDVIVGLANIAALR